MKIFWKYSKLKKEITPKIIISVLCSLSYNLIMKIKYNKYHVDSGDSFEVSFLIKILSKNCLNLSLFQYNAPLLQLCLIVKSYSSILIPLIVLKSLKLNIFLDKNYLSLKWLNSKNVAFRINTLPCHDKQVFWI
jgi:hypothetical protein